MNDQNQTEVTLNHGDVVKVNGIPLAISGTAKATTHKDNVQLLPQSESQGVTDQAIEQEIKDKGLTAPRVTFRQIEALMAEVTYHCHVVPGTTTTVCTAIDKDGFTLANGMSACASPENFNTELGEKIAKQNAERQAMEELWKLEGYALKKRLVEGS